MNYKIVYLDKRLGALTVAFYKDANVTAHKSIEIPIVNSKFITGETLDKFILSQAPDWLEDRKALVATTTNFDYIQNKVEAN